MDKKELLDLLTSFDNPPELPKEVQLQSAAVGITEVLVLMMLAERSKEKERPEKWAEAMLTVATAIFKNTALPDVSRPSDAIVDEAKGAMLALVKILQQNSVKEGDRDV